MGSSVSIGLIGGMILYFLGRATYPEATKNNPNNSKTIMRAVGIKVAPQNRIMRIARTKQVIPMS